MNENNLSPEQEIISKSEAPFVFISHDSRDFEIAEAFSKMLKSVSAGMLKSFRSSDNKGTQGIEFGIEWYPKIIDTLHSSTDVVCILTELSINRPWLLFEAGMAKGKLNTPILGVAVGVPLGEASTGPFAQFQNCDDDTASLTKLVNQLVKKLPNSEPDEEVIKQQVESFKNRTNEIIKKRQEKNVKVEEKKPVDPNESAKLFEEVKLMFKELPVRIENASIKGSPKPPKKVHPLVIEELIHFTNSRKFSSKIGLQIILSPFKQDFPWIYETGIDLLERLIKNKKVDFNQDLKEYIRLIEFTFEHPIMREFYRDEYESRYFRELPFLINKYFKEYLFRNEELIEQRDYEGQKLD